MDGNVNDTQRLELSKSKLLKYCTTSIRTTMIGAISDLETEFEEFLDDPQFEQIFVTLRKSILDRGNDEIRKLEREFNNYKVIWKGTMFKWQN